ncbi:uncharacterized protein LOC144708300 [Wolffia australiana]
MPRRGAVPVPEAGEGSCVDGDRANMGVPRATGTLGVSTTFPTLSRTNYPLWAKRMKILLEAYGLWSAVIEDDVPRMRDRLAMATIFGTIPEDLQLQLDEDKSSKETWETLRVMNIGVARVKQTRIHALKREYENLKMGKDDLVVDFVGTLSRIVSEMGNLGEKLTEGDVIGRLLQATPTKFDNVTVAIEQFCDIKSMSLEELVGSWKMQEDKL